MLVRRAKSAYYQRVFAQDRGTAAMWSRLRHLGLVKQKRSSFSEWVREVNLTHSLNELNMHFVGGAARREDDGVVFGGFPDGLQETFNDENFYWEYITPLDVRKALAGFGSNAVGADGLPLKMLRLVASCDILFLRISLIIPLSSRLFLGCGRVHLSALFLKLNNQLNLITIGLLLSCLPYLNSWRDWYAIRFSGTLRGPTALTHASSLINGVSLRRPVSCECLMTLGRQLTVAW